MNTRLGVRALRVSLVGSVWKPPSTVTSRGESPSRSSSLTVAGQQRVLSWVARGGRCREDQPAGTTSGVLRHFGELGHIAELVRLAELALPDRAGIRV